MRPLFSVNSSFMITDGAYRSISESALRALPYECCGVLAGHDGTCVEIMVAWELSNQAGRDRSRQFEIDIGELYATTLRARAMRLDVIGFFHSHPEGEPRPSLSDIRNGSGWPGYVNAIYACEPSSEAGRLRIYRTEAASWREISYEGVSQ